MSQMLRKDADRIISASLKAVLPDEAVQRALRAYQPRGGRTLLVAAGKAAGRWRQRPSIRWAMWTAVWS